MGTFLGSWTMVGYGGGVHADLSGLMDYGVSGSNSGLHQGSYIHSSCI